MSESNVFIIINLGCEMLYVIEQRLKAQKIVLDKSIQVIDDITSVLLDSKFIERIILGNERRNLLTPEHCKIILNDIAYCSLMRLDENSMNKLWDLITMIFKWQLFITNKPQHLLDITYHHLNGVSKIYPNLKKTVSIDYIKNMILDYWNSNQLQSQYQIYNTIKLWFNVFHVKISILIRLGFQNANGDFIQNVSENYREFIDNIGGSIYKQTEKVDEIESKEWKKLQKLKQQNIECDSTNNGGKFENFANQLNMKQNEKIDNEFFNDSIIFNDVLLDINKDPTLTAANSNSVQQKQFIHVKTAYTNSSLHSWGWENLIVSGGIGGGNKTALKTLLDKNS